jgi:hypothetical protein
LRREDFRLIVAQIKGREDETKFGSPNSPAEQVIKDIRRGTRKHHYSGGICGSCYSHSFFQEIAQNFEPFSSELIARSQSVPGSNPLKAVKVVLRGLAKLRRLAALIIDRL